MLEQLSFGPFTKLERLVVSFKAHTTPRTTNIDAVNTIWGMSKSPLDRVEIVHHRFRNYVQCFRRGVPNYTVVTYDEIQQEIWPTGTDHRKLTL